MVLNMLSNTNFDGQFNMCPYIKLDEEENHQWSNVMSGNIVWRWSVSRTIDNLYTKNYGLMTQCYDPGPLFFFSQPPLVPPPTAPVPAPAPAPPSAAPVPTSALIPSAPILVA
jgi:hypothetical protein